MASNPLKTKMVDTFVNVVTGLGLIGKDKRATATFAAQVMTDQEIIAAYEGDWIARNVVDIPAKDMVRAWRTFQTDKDKIKLLEDEEKRLDLRSKVQQAKIWARLFGGAAILLDDGTTDPAQLKQPLRITAKGQLKAIHVLPRQRCVPGEIDWTFGSEFFNQPGHYTITSGQSGGTEVHPSRVVTFMGAPKADPDVGKASEARVYGDSVLVAGRDAILQATGALAAMATLTEEAKTDVIKINGLLAQSINKEFRDALTERWQLAATLKSLSNVTLIDGQEEWETKTINFAGMTDVGLMFLQVVAGAYGIPMTRFLSQSPAGMNSTGESDLQNYDQTITSGQDNDLRPRLDRIDEVLIISALGTKPEGIYSKFNPLRIPTPKEQQELETSEAAAARSIADSGLVPMAALEVAFQNRLIEGGRWPGLEKAIADAKAGILLPFEDPADEGNDIDPRTGQPYAEDDPRNPHKPEAANENEPREITVNGGKVAIKAGVKKPKRDSVRDAAPRTLYVSRRLVNADEVVRWAKAQGFPSTVEAADLHVTVAFSRSLVDWMKVPQDWWGDEDGRLVVRAGGARLVEKVGNKGAVALLFASEALEYRHRNIENAGADRPVEWQQDDFQPHVTITYDGDGVDLAKVEPFQGKLIFGPEIFEEVVENWQATVREA